MFIRIIAGIFRWLFNLLKIRGQKTGQDWADSDMGRETRQEFIDRIRNKNKE